MQKSSSLNNKHEKSIFQHRKSIKMEKDGNMASVICSKDLGSGIWNLPRHLDAMLGVRTKKNPLHLFVACK